MIKFSINYRYIFLKLSVNFDIFSIIFRYIIDKSAVYFDNQQGLNFLSMQYINFKNAIESLDKSSIYFDNEQGLNILSVQYINFKNVIESLQSMHTFGQIPLVLHKLRQRVPKTA